MRGGECRRAEGLYTRNGAMSAAPRVGMELCASRRDLLRAGAYWRWAEVKVEVVQHQCIFDVQPSTSRLLCRMSRARATCWRGSGQSTGFRRRRSVWGRARRRADTREVYANKSICTIRPRDCPRSTRNRMSVVSEGSVGMWERHQRAMANWRIDVGVGRSSPARLAHGRSDDERVLQRLPCVAASVVSESASKTSLDTFTVVEFRVRILDASTNRERSRRAGGHEPRKAHIPDRDGASVLHGEAELTTEMLPPTYITTADAGNERQRATLCGCRQSLRALEPRADAQSDEAAAGVPNRSDKNHGKYSSPRPSGIGQLNSFLHPEWKNE
ncbi:hypothetical protein B0H19DRAFT_1069409 [Mycena capillaripes]|nr:hypothetical protein B0H19DRAFT_1069409 [Mycena capillaripes]